MRNVNTNPASTSAATRRAQLVTNAVIAAYIQEISDGQPVSGNVPAPFAKSTGVGAASRMSAPRRS
jgi:hypothetical protein